MCNIIYSLRSKEDFLTMCGALVKSEKHLVKLQRVVNPLKRVGRDQKDKQIFIDVLREEKIDKSGYSGRSRVKIFDN